MGGHNQFVEKKQKGKGRNKKRGEKGKKEREREGEQRKRERERKGSQRSDYQSDECLKHSGYTRVCLTFLTLFYI